MHGVSIFRFEVLNEDLHLSLFSIHVHSFNGALGKLALVVDSLSGREFDLVFDEWEELSFVRLEDPIHLSSEPRATFHLEDVEDIGLLASRLKRVGLFVRFLNSVHGVHGLLGDHSF